jgi:ribulose-5-phosphate 4-epimerase/fuculose-1-phosphate aldolase
MTFVPTSEKLIPDLTPREELALLARSLWSHGYSDHLAGHITCNLRDGTLLCNPWLLSWDEVCPSQVIRIDLDGNVVEGDWSAPLGIPLHLALHRKRPGVSWVMHNHPLFATVWADIGEVPAALDQSSSIGCGEIALVNEYQGGVNNADAAADAVDALGDAEIGLLRGHGVLVTGRSARAIFQRAMSLETRCKHAWYARSTGAAVESTLPPWWIERQRNSTGEGPVGFWEATLRRILRSNPDIIDR